MLPQNRETCYIYGYPQVWRFAVHPPGAEFFGANLNEAYFWTTLRLLRIILAQVSKVGIQYIKLHLLTIFVSEMWQIRFSCKPFTCIILNLYFSQIYVRWKLNKILQLLVTDIIFIRFWIIIRTQNTSYFIANTTIAAALCSFYKRFYI